tara:strand:+ start:851 stop:1525 length:675 start_codon:yes stop_codon:yes gene_type:complete
MATVIIQARTSSKRFPNKVLKKLFDRQILYFLYLRLRKSKIIKKIIVSTSNLKVDKKIIKICRKNKILFFKGSHKNVVSRLYLTAKKFNLNFFVRINADSPVLDMSLVNKGIKIYKSKKVDLVTNVFPRSYPKGQSVEVIRTSALKKILKKSLEQDDKEHVTRYIYKNPEKFKIINFKNKINKSNINLSIDKKQDLVNMKKRLKKYKNNLINMKVKQLIQVYEK